MKKRILCCFFVIGLFSCTYFMFANATTNYYYMLTIGTRNVTNAGTDSQVNAGFTFYEGGTYDAECDLSGNDFEKGSSATYGFSTNKGDPWMIKAIYLKTDGGGTASGWAPGNVDIYLPYLNNASTFYAGTVGFGETWLDGGSASSGCESITKRRIGSWGGLTSWSDSVYMNNQTTGTYTKTWDCQIADQYGTYNAYLYNDIPTFQCVSSNSAINGYTFVPGNTSGTTASFSFDYATIYSQMIAANIGQVTYTFTYTLPSRSTRTDSPYTNSKVETITIYRRCFEMGNSNITSSPVYSPRQDYNYFNINRKNVTITLEPTSIHCLAPNTTQKNDLTTNFQCSAALYSGNSTETKLCDMTVSSNDGVIVFTGTIPDNVSTNGEGVSLYLTNVFSSNAGYTYNLNSGNSTMLLYFSSYKADRIAPSVFAVDANNTEVVLTNNIKNYHYFWLTGSETLFSTKNVAHTPENEALFKYELYKYDFESSSYNSDPSLITNYDGTGSVTTAQAPISTAILTDTPINLKLSEYNEGSFKLVLYAYDDANNVVGGVGDAFEINDVLIDNLAPRVSVNTIVQNQAVDGSKSVNYTFEIDDISSTIDNPEVWARTYYCFVPSGQTVPAFELGNTPESGTIETTIGTWAFVEGGGATTTAVLKVGKNADFTGKLYYFTQDSCGNDSRTEYGDIYSQNVSLYNKDSRDTLVQTEEPSYPLSLYDIVFNEDDDLITEYHWVTKDPDSDFSQNYIVYNSESDVGAAVQMYGNGFNGYSQHIMNGVYTLQYKVTVVSSGNYMVFTKDYIFDNQMPLAQLIWSTANENPSDYQQLSLLITDKSGLISAFYQIVNADGSIIEGYDEISLPLTDNTDGTKQVDESLMFMPLMSGVYSINFSAQDKNGYFIPTGIPANTAYLQFAIRAEKPVIVSIDDNLTKNEDNIGVSPVGDYILNVSVDEPMKNAMFMTKNQVVWYRVSTDNITYTDWSVAQGIMSLGEQKLTHNFTIENPLRIKSGLNKVYVQVACMNEGETSVPQTSLISEAVYHSIYDDIASADYDFGVITWSLSSTAKTNKPITAFVTITDQQNTLVDAVITDVAGNIYEWSEVIDDEYCVLLDQSGVYTVTATNDLGNVWREYITVTNVDATLPVISRLTYSTPLNKITTKSVSVQISSFSKPNVTVTGIETAGTLTENDIVYTPGGTTIRFKKNGSVSVFFIDEYGNTNSDIITVSNINTDPPRLKAVPVLAADKLSVNITFEQDCDTNGVPYDLYRELTDLFIYYNGITYNANTANFTIKNNGSYKFTIYDVAGSTQYINITVDAIDNVAPKITQVTWSYEYFEEVTPGVWELKSDSKTITPGNEAGYIVAEDSNKGTNQNVIVTVETDKPVSLIGSKDPLSNSVSMLFSKNGLYVFNLKAENGTSVSYGVDIEVIDKTAPVLEFGSGNELVFIEGMTPQKNSEYAYMIEKLMDYVAYDNKNGEIIDLTDRVTIDFGSFDPDFINNNNFDRNNPYYITYNVYDNAGNCTTVRRTIRLVGFYDTLVLINGVMPNSSNSASVNGNEIVVSLKNFSGISYAKIANGIYTMGQMKTRGTKLTEVDGKYTVSGLAEGWYTVYLQTDKRDYFTISVYVSNKG